jgi:hypothetical protein
MEYMDEESVFIRLGLFLGGYQLLNIPNGTSIRVQGWFMAGMRQVSIYMGVCRAQMIFDISLV